MDAQNGFLAGTPIVTVAALYVLWLIFLLDYIVLAPKGVQRFGFARFVMGKVEAQPGPIGSALCLVSSKVRKGQVWRLLSAMLNHGGLYHIVVNSIALWVVGSILELRIGLGAYFLVLLLSGTGAAICNFYILQSEYSFGFSMAIYGAIGIIAAMLLRDPKLLGEIDWPSRIVLLVYIIGAIPADKYAWVEHSGGFVCGILLAFWVI